MTSIIGSLIDAASDFGQMAWSQYLNKKNMRDQAALQYQYAERYAKNSPSWNIQGLRDAGLNPILAVSNGVNLGANIPNISNSSPSGGGKGTKFTEALNNIQQNQIGLKQASAAETQSNASVIQAEASAKQANAALLRAQSEASLNAAKTNQVNQEIIHNRQGGGFKTDTAADIYRAVFKSADGLNDLQKMQDSLYTNAEPYLEHSPKPNHFNPDLTPYGSNSNKTDEPSRPLKRILREDERKSKRTKIPYNWNRPSLWLPPTIGF